jgi:predicted MFS family arabinose efflux permease
MSFFSTVIPVMMRQENFSLASIGLLQLIKLPWILKFLWSPLVDRNCVTVSHYKKWIFSSELIYAVLIFSVAFLDFKENFTTILVLVIISFVASATQDIATDALAVLSFSRKDKSLVNSMQSMGSFAGAMLGGGALLLLFKQIGWNSLLPCLAVFVIIALAPLLFNKEIAIKEKSPAQKAKRTDFYYFFTQKGIWKQIIFLFLYYAGLIGILAMLKPYMVDLGYNMQEIGIMSGVAGTSVAFVSSFTGGFILRRIGRYRSRILFSVCILLATLYFMCLSYCTPTTLMLYIGIFLLWGSYGMATIVVYTTAMDCVREGREGTDFTIQTVITHLSGMCMAIVSGKIGDHAGYHGVFLFEVVLAATSLLFILLFFKKEQTK